jgi:hypothetical protein
MGDQLGGDGPIGGEHEGSGGVAALQLVGRAGQAPADVGQHRHGGLAGTGGVGCAAQGADPRADRADGVVAARRRVEPQGGMDGGGVRLVGVGGDGSGEDELRGRRRGCRQPARKRPAGRLDTQRGGVLVVGRDGPGATPGGHAEGGAHRGPVESVERHVGAPAEDAGHGETIADGARTGNAGHPRPRRARPDG